MLYISVAGSKQYTIKLSNVTYFNGWQPAVHHQMVECYILQWLAASSTTSNVGMLHISVAGSQQYTIQWWNVTYFSAWQPAVHHQMVECYLFQCLAASSTPSNGEMLHISVAGSQQYTIKWGNVTYFSAWQPAVHHQMVKCYIFQRLATSSTPSNGGMLHTSVAGSQQYTIKWWNVTYFSGWQPAVHHQIARFCIMKLEPILKCHKKLKQAGTLEHDSYSTTYIGLVVLCGCKLTLHK